LPALGSFPGRALFLSRLSALFIWQVLWEPPEPPAPCWRTVATIYPLGNCDSLKLETALSYLTRFGAVSYRSSSLSSCIALPDSARTPSEELVNSASAPRLAAVSRGVEPTSLSQPFPSRLGLSRRLACARILPGTRALFVTPFGVFHLADSLGTARAARSVLAHSSNHLPSG